MRPPDWAWRRACELVETGGYATTKYDGELICRVVKHLRKLKGLCTEWGVKRLARREPDIFFALKLAQEDSLRTLEIKARVLARQSNQAIAMHLGVPARVVSLYVELMFDVRGRLDARSWITTQVAGMDPRHAPSPQSLFLLSAYLHGPLLIDDWMTYLRDPTGPYDLTTDDGRRRASIQLLVDTHRLADTEATRRTLVKRLHLLTSIRAKSTKQPTAASAILRSMTALAKQIPWNRDCETVKGQQDQTLNASNVVLNNKAG